MLRLLISGFVVALAVVAGAAAVVPMTVYFNTWLIAGLAISLAILAAGARTLAHS